MYQNHSEDRRTPAVDAKQHPVARTATKTLSAVSLGEFVEDAPLSINVVREQGVLTLEVFGEVDLANADTLDAALVRAESSDADQIVLDLGGVGFIDSAGLRVLVLATQRSARDSDRLGIIRGTGQVSRILALTGIDSALKLLDRVPGAEPKAPAGIEPA